METAIKRLQGVDTATILGDAVLTALLLKTYGTLWSCVPKLCSKSLAKYHQEIVTQGLKKLKRMKKLKFRLKPNVIVYDARNADMITNDNLTNEFAERYINADPKRIANFEIYPDSKTVEKELTAKQIVEIINDLPNDENLEIELKKYESDKRKSVQKSIEKKRQ